jgi:hypothetical protein
MMDDAENRDATRPAALITGASGGIGYELAIEFARHGHNVVLTARRRPQLEILASKLREEFGVSARVVTADLTQPQAPAALIAELERAGVAVGILVNNAGFASHGPLAETDLATTLDLLQVNITALTALTRLVLPGMLAGGGGRILNVASTAAFQAGPLMATYYASKAYVLLFSEALARELAGSGVVVSALCPGPTRTGFQRRARIEGLRLVRGAGLMDAGAVAAAGYRGLMRGRRIIVPGTLNRLGVQSLRIAPRRLVTAMVHFLHGHTPGATRA